MLRYSLAFLLLPVVSAATQQDITVHLTQALGERHGEAITWQDILQVTDIGGVAVSPDGNSVAFIARQADEACNCYVQEFRLHSLQTGRQQVVAELGQPFKALYPGGVVHGSPVTPAPRWSPDGRYIAFLSSEGGRPALYVFDSKERTSQPVFTDHDPVYGFTWTPQAGVLLYQTGRASPKVTQSFAQGLREGFLYGKDFWEARPGSLPLLPEVPIVVGDGSMFGGERDALAILKRVSLSGAVSSPQEGDATLFHDAGGSFAMGPYRTPGLVRDRGGEYSVALDYPYPGAYEARIILKSSAGWHRVVACNTLCAARVASVYWDSSLQAFVVLREGHGADSAEPRYHFRRIDIPKLQEVELFAADIASDHMGPIDPNCDLRGQRLVCVEESIASPPRLVMLDRKGLSTVIYDPNPALRVRHYNRIEKLEWKNAEGGHAYSYLVYPRGYRKAERYPLVVVQYSAHGFGRGGTGNENPIHPYAEAGFFVLVFSHPPNPPTYTEPQGTENEKGAAQYRARHAWIQDSLDIVIDHLVDTGHVDARQVAYTGLSGGANLIDYSLAQGRDIAAVISSTCCTGPELVWTHPWLLWQEGHYERLGFGNPLKDADYLKKWAHQSPSLHVEKIRAPILANMSQDEMLASLPLLARMRASRRPMELYVYADEWHVKYQPAHRAAIFRRNIDWLRFWLQGFEGPSPSKAEQYARWSRMAQERKTRALEGQAKTYKP